MVIRALDLVDRCDTAAQGWIVHRAVKDALSRGDVVELSFDGVFDVPSSFVNTAIVSLLGEYTEEFIKRNLVITRATRQIADMVRRCLANGLRAKGAA